MNILNILSMLDELFPYRLEDIKPELTIAQIEKVIMEAVATLTPYEQSVTIYIWGLGVDVLYKLKDISAVTGIKAGHIRRIEAKAIGRLQHKSRKLEQTLFNESQNQKTD